MFWFLLPWLSCVWVFFPGCLKYFLFFLAWLCNLMLSVLHLPCLGFAALLKSVDWCLQKVLSNYLLNYFFCPIIFSSLSFWDSNYMYARPISVVSRLLCFVFLIVFYLFIFALTWILLIVLFKIIDLSLALSVLLIPMNYNFSYSHALFNDGDTFWEKHC